MKIKPQEINSHHYRTIRVLGGNRNAFRPQKPGLKLQERILLAKSRAELDNLKLEFEKVKGLAPERTVRRWELALQTISAQIEPLRS